MRLPFPLLPTPVRWLAVVAVAGFIFYASIITAPPETVVDDVDLWFVPLSYWRHFIAYATLAYTLAYATTHWEPDRWTMTALVIAIVTCYGAGIEVGQWFVPGRHFDLLDILVNAIGASTVLAWYLLRPYLDLTSIAEFFRY